MRNMSRSFTDDEHQNVQRWQLPDVDTMQNTDDGHILSRSPVTAKQIEQIQQQAYKEAYDEGFAKGLREGLEKANQQTSAKLALVTSILNKCSHPFKELDAEVEEQLVQLAIAMTRQLVRREIKSEPGGIVSVVREAMEVLPAASRDVRIFLHPDDAVILKKTLSTSDNNYWKLLEDPILGRGDCRIHTETSSIDATVEHRLASVVANMLGGLRKDDQIEDDSKDDKA